MSDFESAKSYQIEGYDHYDSPAECLASWADEFVTFHRSSEFLNEEMLRVSTLPVVNAYRLAERANLKLDNMSDDMMTQFEEAFSDDNLTPRDDIDRIKDAAAYTRCKQAIWTALAEFEEALPVTRLESKPFASRTYTPDEVVAILREVRPAWFREVANG